MALMSNVIESLFDWFEKFLLSLSLCEGKIRIQLCSAYTNGMKIPNTPMEWNGTRNFNIILMNVCLVIILDTRTKNAKDTKHSLSVL